MFVEPFRQNPPYQFCAAWQVINAPSELVDPCYEVRGHPHHHGFSRGRGFGVCHVFSSPGVDSVRLLITCKQRGEQGLQPSNASDHNEPVNEAHHG